MEERRPRYGSLLAACALSLLVAGIAGFAGLMAGGPFMTKEPDPAAAWACWGVAGLALAAPVAALPTLGFRVRPVVAITAAIALGAVVVVLGYLFTMKDVP